MPIGFATIQITALALILLVIAYIAAARWLQQRSAWITPHAEVDALYILAGSPSRSERIDAVLDWVSKYDSRPATIFIPEDRAAGNYSSESGRVVPVAQCQIERLEQSCIPRLNGSSRPAGTISSRIPSRWHDIVVVPGHYHGTDGEMQALANFLEPHPAYRRVALVTSRSHIRRALLRARTHSADPRILGVIPARCTLRDYAPRRVISEYLQLLRDALGLTHAPFPHRGWWKN